MAAPDLYYAMFPTDEVLTTLGIDDADLDAAASALCDAALKWVIQPALAVRESLRFANIEEAAREIYRELAMSVIESLRERP